jgi:integrase
MARGVRLRIGACQYQDASGIDTIVKYRGLIARERWPLDSDPEERARWVARSRSELMDRHADDPTDAPPRPSKSKATLTDDITRFLKQREGRAGYAADKSHLQAWALRLGPRIRRTLTREDVNLAIAAWRAEKKADKTIIHRCRALRDLYRVLDGPKAATPLDGADLPKTPHPHPVAPPMPVLRKVAKHMAKHATPKYYARFLVLSLCAQRPAQVERAKPEDLDFRRKTWIVRSAKNEPSHTIHLNAEQVEAWKLFAKLECWGQRAFKQYWKALRDAGYPKAMSPYNVRHAAAQDALRRGADLGDVQGLLGHTEIETTRRMYAPLLSERQKKVATLMNGRLGKGSDT